MIKFHQSLDLYGKNIFEKVILTPPFRLKAPMENEACFYYVVKGNSSASTPSGKVHAVTGEGLVLQCGNYINEYIQQHIDEECEAVAVHFYPKILTMLFDSEFPDFMEKVNKVKPLRHQKIQSSSLLKSYIDSLQFYFSNPELVSEELMKLKLKEIILLLANTDNAQQIKDLLASMFTPEKLEFKKVVENNIYNNLTLEEMAFLTHLSLSSFKREFKKQYNTSPAKYIRERKLEKAKGLLVNSSLRISDIAFESGFNDLAHFSKSFLKFSGFSPSDFRLNHLDKSVNQM